MNRLIKTLAPLVALIALGTMPATAQDAPALPVISIQQVDAENSDVYAMLLAKSNANIKEKTGQEKFLRVYVGMAAGKHSDALFVVSAAPSSVELNKTWAAIADDNSGAALRASFGAVRTLGPRSLWKAIRFDGSHDDAWVYNVFMKVNDEAGYLKAFEGLRNICDDLGFKDVHLNIYRVMAGGLEWSNASHFVSCNAASGDRLAALMDAIHTDDKIRAWVASSASLRTVNWSATYREITK